MSESKPLLATEDNGARDVTPVTSNTSRVSKYMSLDSNSAVSIESSEDSRTETETETHEGEKLSAMGDQENSKADELARKLIACNGNADLEIIVMKRSLDISYHEPTPGKAWIASWKAKHKRNAYFLKSGRRNREVERSVFQKMVTMISLALLGLLTLFVLLQLSSIVVGPPRQPVGPYKIVEVQEGEDFFNHYTFYDGKDSEGSKGYITYVGKAKATELNIANVTYEDLDDTVLGEDNDSRKLKSNSNGKLRDRNIAHQGQEPFVYMSTSPTEEGPRNSVRLEGLKRFNRGLFILDLRHMPAGCSTWPAFWLTDEANWPVNGEIDIVEGCNKMSVAKTALHTTRGCEMFDVPLGVQTGYWDTAVGVPNDFGGVDWTVREARDCFVYDPHQWLNQGCVAEDNYEGTLGTPLNKKGGGIFVLEWDPINRFIKSWVFTPSKSIPQNLRDSLRAAQNKDTTNNVRPDPWTWGLPYAHFPIGEGTSCGADHFRNMHLIFNTALCGTVAGSNFFKHCPDLQEKYGSCENYVKANTEGMNEVYWKIRGVYIFQREWEKSWVN